MVDIVNITAGGDLGHQLLLEELASDISAFSSSYEPEIYPGVFIQFEEDGPKSTIYRSGKYVITGATSEKQLHQESTKLYDSLQELDVQVNEDKPVIYNMVFTADLNRELNLPQLAIHLGLDKTEYEPEQSPFLVYRPDSTNCTITIPRTGKIVITGIKEKSEAEEIYKELSNDLDEVFAG